MGHLWKKREKREKREKKEREQQRAARSTPSPGKSTGTARVWVGWRTAPAGCNSARRFRVSCFRSRNPRGSIVSRSSRRCRIALGRIRTCTVKVRNYARTTHPRTTHSHPTHSLPAYLTTIFLEILGDDDDDEDPDGVSVAPPLAPPPPPPPSPSSSGDAAHAASPAAPPLAESPSKQVVSQ
jgi:hypothetical protein